MTLREVLTARLLELYGTGTDRDPGRWGAVQQLIAYNSLNLDPKEKSTRRIIPGVHVSKELLDRLTDEQLVEVAQVSFMRYAVQR